MTSQFSKMTSPSIFFNVALFLLLSLVTGCGVITIFFYKGLTRNSEIEIHPSEFCPISEDWAKLGIPNLAKMSGLQL